MSKYKVAKIPYIESHYQGGKQHPTAIILSPTFTTSKKGAALGIANAWNASSSVFQSGHYSIDEETIYRCANDRVIAGHKDVADKGAIRIAICADPLNGTIFWDLGKHGLVLSRTAEFVALLTAMHDIRRAYLSEEDIVRWRRRRSRRRGGIYVDVSSGWPHDLFLNEIKTSLLKGIL